MVTLQASCLYCRQREITDALVDLLIATVHRINARADTKGSESPETPADAGTIFMNAASCRVATKKRLSASGNLLYS
jgi:hypothetical protein